MSFERTQNSLAMTQQLLLQCAREGIRFAVEGGNLRLKSAGSVDPELLDSIRRQKVELVALLSVAQASSVDKALEPVRRAADRERAPLSFAQENFWMAEALSDTEGMYNFCLIVELRGPLDLPALQAALDAIVSRHTPLRTLLLSDGNGPPFQRVCSAQPVPLLRVDLSGGTASEVVEYLQQAFKERFKFESNPPCRVHLLTLGTEHWKLAFVTHHIASDGWSIDLLLKELGAFYNAFHTRSRPDLPQVDIDYVDYAVWERSAAESSWFRSGLEYWKSRLAGVPILHALPTDRPRPQTQSFAIAQTEHCLDSITLRRLEEYARREGTTLFVLLVTALSVLIHRYSGDDDIVIGTPIANRLRHELSPLFGLFVNILPIRTRIAPEQSFSQLLRRAQSEYLEDIRHQSIPFAKVVSEVAESYRSLSHATVVQIGFVLHNNSLTQLKLQGLQCRTEFIIPSKSQYDLNIAAQERDGKLHFLWQYATDLFDASRIERMSAHYELLLREILASPDAILEQLKLLSADERGQMLALGRRQSIPVADNSCSSLAARLEAPVYVLDRHLEPVPIGVTGEMYIGRERSNEEKCAAHQFVADPFVPNGRGNLYRTGVLALWREDGVLVRGANAAAAYWKEQLSFIPEATALGVELTSPSKTNARKLSRRVLPHEVSSALESLTRNSGIAGCSVLEAAWAYLIHSYTGEDSVAFGRAGVVPPGLNTERTRRPAMSAIPVIVRVTEAARVRDWLERIDRAARKRGRYDSLPLPEILQCGDGAGRKPLDTQLVVTSDQSSIPGSGGAPCLDCGLALIVDDGPRTLELSFDPGQYAEEVAEGILESFEEILRSITQANGATRVRDLSWVSMRIAREVTARWNDTHKEHDANRCVHQLFEAAASEYSGSVALRFENEHLTYRELNARANQLAWFLVRHCGVSSGSLVGVCLNRSVELMVTLLGILKAGAAYLPLDPTYPAARLTHMLEDAKPTALLTTRALQDATTTSAIPLLCWDDPDFVGSVSAESTINPDFTTREHGQKLAYVIYTSGSTGKPKGVMIEHHSVSNFLLSMRREPGIARADTLLAVTSASFDIHVLELFAPLICGATVLMASGSEYADPEALARLIETHRVTVMQATPATWVALLDYGWAPSHDIKVLCGGEALAESLRERLLASGKIELWNMYGPTETCVWSAVKRITDRVAIGPPIDNTTFHVLDRKRVPVPLGVPGHLHIGGAGLARGYLNRPDLTDAAFIRDIPPALGETRLYRTGDCVKRTAEGDLLFVGRLDNQVKIRGFRIELTEVVTAIEALPYVSQAAVVAKSRADGSKYLAAFVVAEDAERWSSERTSDDLRHVLPDHMIPSVFERLPALPKTLNGKVDLKSLAARAMGGELPSMTRAAPQTDSERIIAQLWSELLNIPLDSISIDENLLHMGADSVQVLLFVGRAKKQGIDVKAKQVMESPTIRTLAARVTRYADDTAAGVYAGPAPMLTETWGVLNCDPVWRRFFINVVFDWAAPIDVAAMQGAFEAIVKTHDLLRARFRRIDGVWQQTISGDYKQRMVESVDISCGWEDPDAVGEIKQLLAVLHEQMTLDQGPLINSRVIRDVRGENKLLVTASHLVTDGFSLAILFQDLFETYARLRVGAQAPALPGKVPITEWAQRCREFVRTLNAPREMEYWRSRPLHKCRRLPVDYPEEDTTDRNIVATSANLVDVLDETHTRIFLAVPRKLGMPAGTFFELFLAHALLRWSGAEALLLAVHHNGRSILEEALDLDLSRTVAVFAMRRNIFLEKVSTGDVCADLRSMHQQVLSMPHAAIGYWMLENNTSDPEVAAFISRLPRASVWLNYFGVTDLVVGQRDTSIYPNPSRFQESIDPVSNWPQTARERVFMILGRVEGGQLRLTWEYGAKLHKQETIRSLIQQTRAELIRVLDLIDRLPDLNTGGPQVNPRVREGAAMGIHS